MDASRTKDFQEAELSFRQCHTATHNAIQRLLQYHAREQPLGQVITFDEPVELPAELLPFAHGLLIYGNLVYVSYYSRYYPLAEGIASYRQTFDGHSGNVLLLDDLGLESMRKFLRRLQGKDQLPGQLGNGYQWTTLAQHDEIARRNG